MAAVKLRLFHPKLVDSILNPQISNRIISLTYCGNKPEKPDLENKNLKDSNSNETIVATSDSDRVNSKETESTKTDSDSKSKISGFAAFDSKQMTFLELKKKSESFATLLRNSKFIDLGDPEGKVVVGTIYHIVGDDLYIDFGWKFPTVCSKPKIEQSLYIRGAKVRLLVKNLELSARFLGANSDITLCEADCVLLGLVHDA